MGMKDVDRELIPDACISCQEIMINEGTLCCDCTGKDVLPFQVCDEYKRLKWYQPKIEELQIAV